QALVSYLRPDGGHRLLEFGENVGLGLIRGGISETSNCGGRGAKPIENLRKMDSNRFGAVGPTDQQQAIFLYVEQLVSTRALKSRILLSALLQCGQEFRIP